MPHPSCCRSPTDRPRPEPGTPDAVSRLRDHGSYLCLATAALAAVALLGLAGCQTPPQTAAPVYGATVAPPATGMIGQPAPYGVTAPQGVSYPPTVSTPMPGPATSWQGVTQPAAPSPSTWSWAQSGNVAAPAAVQQPGTYAVPNTQQYGTQLANQANQYQQSLTNQANQYANQYANQAQQYANQTQQQLNNQLQGATNQFQQGLNSQTQQFNNQLQQGMQSAQQQLNSGMQQANSQLQQAMPQMPTGPQQQTANGSWWPFSSSSGMPPARAVPARPASY
ncbi:MAG: hypothetical protein RLZZ111_582 [Planctomycetota bacterium]